MNTRFLLHRELGGLLTEERSVLFVMLNPSTADATEDDPTIRRCMGFARRLGGSALRVVNLSPVRATNPRNLEGLWIAGEPLSLNVEHVFREVARASIVIAAWGAHDLTKIYGAEFTRNALVGINGIELWCLGKTKNGSPRHPLYIPKAVELERYP